MPRLRRGAVIGTLVVVSVILIRFSSNISSPQTTEIQTVGSFAGDVDVSDGDITLDSYDDGKFSVWVGPGNNWRNITLPPLPDVSFLPEYKNPCWNKLGRPGTDGGATFHCLPYVYIIGAAKCATTDLWMELIKHPSIAQTKKCLHWWGRRRFGLSIFKRPITPFTKCVSLWDHGAKQIMQHHLDGYADDMIIVDGSVSMFGEKRVRGRHHNNSRQLVPRTLHKFQPSAKIVMILRNPATRIFSGLDYFQLILDVNKSHTYISQHVSRMKACLATSDLWSCAYTIGIEELNGMDALLGGLYYPYVFDWMQVFPRSQIKVVRTEDYAADKVSVLNEIFDFLGLDNLPDEIADVMRENLQAKNKGHSRHEALNKTRVILHDFYQPYNEMLAELLQDQRYLWTD